MSLSMAALTTAALAAPAFAASSANQTVVKTTYAEIPISVTVPSSGTATINPYGLPVEVKKNSANATAAKITGHQITTQPLYILNNGDVALSVGATVTTVVTGSLEIVDSKPAADETSKQAMVTVDFQQSNLTADATLDDSTKDDLIDEFADWDYTAYSSTSTTQILLSTDEPASASGLGTAKAMQNGKYQKDGIVEFRLDGYVTEDPEEAWTTKDGFTATIAFTFKPDTTTSGGTN
jgi:hypothetical protein